MGHHLDDHHRVIGWALSINHHDGGPNEPAKGFSPHAMPRAIRGAFEASFFGDKCSAGTDRGEGAGLIGGWFGAIIVLCV